MSRGRRSIAGLCHKTRFAKRRDAARALRVDSLTTRPKAPLASLTSRLRFPDPARGRGPLGILGAGSELDPGTILTAYHAGIFPWPAPEYGEDFVLWCSPSPRALFPMEVEPHWSRSLKRSMKKKPFDITVDTAFDAVLEGCADRREGTWITTSYHAAYKKLFELGWAHSLEVWNLEKGALVGGIYGLAIGSAFSAESMFHFETDASKVAFASLVMLLRAAGFTIFDAQVMNPHLASLGVVDVPRAEFLARLEQAKHANIAFPAFG